MRRYKLMRDLSLCRLIALLFFVFSPPVAAQSQPAPQDAAAAAADQDAAIQAALRDRLAAQTPGQLIAEFQSLISAYETRAAALEESVQEARRLARAANQQVETVAALRPPIPETAAPNEESAVHAAERAAALRRAALEFYSDRAKALRRLKRRVNAALHAVTQATVRLEPMVEETMVLEALETLLVDHVSRAEAARLGLGGGRFADRFAELRQVRDEINAAHTRFQDLAAHLDDMRSVARSATRAARRAVRQSEAALAREQDWSVFVDDLRDLSGAALIAAFEEADQEFRALSRRRRAIDRRRAALEEEINAAAATLRANVDPVALTARADGGVAFAAALSQRGLPPVADSAAQIDDSQGQSADDDAPPPNEITRLTNDLRDLRDDVVVRRATYYQGAQVLRAQAEETLTEALRKLRGRQTELAKVFDAARRGWAAADILARRLRRGEIDDAPERLSFWSDRDALLQISGVQAQIAALISHVDAQIADMRAGAVFADLPPNLEAWREVLDTEIQHLRDARRLAEQFDAIASLDDLGEIERQRIETQIAARVSADLGLYDTLDDFFASDDIQTIDELLRRYYERLVISERQLRNIDQRKALLTQTIEQAQTARPALEALGAALTEVAAHTERRFDIEATLAQAALSPVDAPDLLTDLNARYETASLTLDDVAAPPDDLEGDALEAAQTGRVVALNAPWALAAGYEAWAAAIAQRVAPLGGLDSRVEAYQSQIAQLESQRADIQRSIDRLQGLSPEALTALAFDQKDIDLNRLALGEIGVLQAQRRERINANAMVSAVSLVVIPLIALVAIFLANRSGRRAIARVEKRRADAPGARDRAETLNRLFQSAWMIFVVAAAIIYMLKAVNVDVTPLLASLGIFGLAVAFGAQQIVRDVFSGFFLLLENQLNKGEWVVVNGVMAEVEDVGLRITRMREYQTGMVHYVPNGEILNVANYNRGHWRTFIEFAAPFGVRPEEVRAVLQLEIDAFKDDPEYSSKLKSLSLFNGVYEINYDVSGLCYAVSMEIYGFDLNPPRVFRERVIERLQEAGISLAVAVEVGLRDEDVQRIQVFSDAKA